MTMETEYARHLRAMVLDALARGTDSLVTLVYELPGVFPALVTEVLRSLDRGEHAARVRILLDQAQTAGAEGRPRWATGEFVPHPADSDWRFSPGSARLISQELSELVDSSHPIRVALLGTPTLVTAISSREPTADIWLVEQNARWKDCFAALAPRVSTTSLDLCTDDLPMGLSGWANVVVIDPPWYECAYEQFLWAAAHVSRLGGWLLATLPREGTRPSARDDADLILRFAEAAGYEPIRSLVGRVRYLTPPFEFNAIRASGIKAAFPEWRSADLLILRLHELSRVPRPKHSRFADHWVECAFGLVRIKLRVERKKIRKDRGSPLLLPIVEGDILPTVSARDPRRGEIDVWTSGNRVFQCENTYALSAVCAHLASGGSDPEAKVASLLGRTLDQVEKRDIGRVASHLREVVEIERQEYTGE